MNLTGQKTVIIGIGKGQTLKKKFHKDKSLDNAKLSYQIISILMLPLQTRPTKWLPPRNAQLSYFRGIPAFDSDDAMDSLKKLFSLLHISFSCI